MATQEKANYAAYVFSSFYLELDPETDPYVNLRDSFLKQWFDPSIRRSYEALASKPQLVPTYKVLVTPTLQYFEPATYEEGNLMLREHRENMFHFIRVAIVDENKESVFFNDWNKPWLDYVERFISDAGGIKLGNRRLNYMAYSNS